MRRSANAADPVVAVPVTVPVSVVLGHGAGTTLSAPVELVEPTGHGIILHLTVQGQPFKVLTNDRAYLTPGPATVVALPADRLHLFGADGVRFA